MMAILSAAASEPTQAEALPVSETLSSAPPDTMHLPALCEETPISSFDIQSTVEQLRKEKEDLEGQLKNEHFSNAVLLAALEKQKADVLAQGARFVAVDTPGSVQELDEQHREEVQVLMQRAEQEIQESVESVKREMQESSAQAVAKAVEECSAAKDAEMSRLEERHRMDMFHQKMAFKRAMLRIVPEMARNLNRWHFGLVSAINNMLPAGSPSEGPSLGANPFGNSSPSRRGAAAPGDPAPPEEEQHAALPHPSGEAVQVRTPNGGSPNDRDTDDAAGASPSQLSGRAEDLAQERNQGANGERRGKEKREKRRKGGDAEASEEAAGTGAAQAVLRTKKRRPPLEEEAPPAKRPRSAPLSSRKEPQTGNAQASTGKLATPSRESPARRKVPKAPKVKAIGSKTKKSLKRTGQVLAEEMQSEPFDSAEDGPSDGREEPGLRATWGTELLMSPGFVPEYDSERWEGQFPWGSQMGLEGGEQTGADAGRGEEREDTGVAWGNQIGLEGGVEMAAEEGGAHEAEDVRMGEGPEPEATQERRNWGGHEWNPREESGEGIGAGAPENEVTRAEEAPELRDDGERQETEAMVTKGEKERNTDWEARRLFVAEEGIQEEGAREEVPSHEVSDRSAREAKSPRARSHYQKLKSLESVGTDESAREGSPRQEGSGPPDTRTPPVRLHLKRLRKVSARGETPGHTLESNIAQTGQQQPKEQARGNERAAHKTAREEKTPAADISRGSEPTSEELAQESEPPTQDMGGKEEPSARIPTRGHEPPSLQPFDEMHRRRVKCRGRGPAGKETYGTLAFEEAAGRIELCWVWCECAECMQGGGSVREPLTPAEFERHAGSARKNWRTSVVCCASGRTLREELGEVPLQRGQKRP